MGTRQTIGNIILVQDDDGSISLEIGMLHVPLSTTDAHTLVRELAGMLMHSLGAGFARVLIDNTTKPTEPTDNQT